MANEEIGMDTRLHEGICPDCNKQISDGEGHNLDCKVLRLATKRMGAAEFRKLGFLQEVNKLVLHPCGLALEVIVNKETGATQFGEVWDFRDDPEGMVFAESDPRRGAQQGKQEGVVMTFREQVAASYADRALMVLFSSDRDMDFQEKYISEIPARAWAFADKVVGYGRRTCGFLLRGGPDEKTCGLEAGHRGDCK